MSTSHLLSSVLERFGGLNTILESAVWCWSYGQGKVASASTWIPNFSTTGFQVSFVTALCCYPVLLGFALVAVCSAAKIGRVRKTFSTLVIVGFSFFLYPVLALLGCAFFWIALSGLLFAVSIAAPLAGAFGLAIAVCEETQKYARAQEAIRATSPEVEDITLCQFVTGFIVGSVTLCTFGAATACLTLLKAPLVFLASVLQGVKSFNPCDIQGSLGCWWICVFAAWLVGFATGLVLLAVGVCISIVVKVAASALWPAYVATGMLRSIGIRRQTQDGCCVHVWDGLKAGYQVFWVADALTNTCITMKFDLLDRFVKYELPETAQGQRETLSEDVQQMTCLQFVSLHLHDGWTPTLEAIAKHLHVPVDVVERAWDSFMEQMKVLGLEALDANLLTEDYVAMCPPSLFIGLPARALLSTVERSPGPEVVLANDLRITDAMRPRGGFADKVWSEFQAAMGAFGSVTLPHDARRALCGMLLAGGGAADELPKGLADAVADFEGLEPRLQEPCRTIQKALVAVSVECSRQSAFKDKINGVIQTLLADRQRDPSNVVPLLAGSAAGV